MKLFCTEKYGAVAFSVLKHTWEEDAGGSVAFEVLSNCEYIGKVFICFFLNFMHWKVHCVCSLETITWEEEDGGV